MGKTARKTAKKETCLFYAVSCLRLYFLSVFSFGLYELYWAYRNWKCVRTIKTNLADENIRPVWRGWFFGFIWFIPLCMRIIKSCKAQYGRYMPLALVYFVCFYATFFCLGDIFSFMVLRILTPLFLLPFQKLINRQSGQVEPMIRWDFIVPLIGFVLTVIVPAFYHVSGMTALLNMTEERQQNFFAASGIIYRYTTLYENVCREQGVSLESYQQVFREQFSEEIGVINQILKKTGLTFDEFMQVMLNDENKVEASETVLSEIEKLRKFFILQMLAANNGRSGAYEDWNEAYDSYMSLKEACDLINEHAKDVIRIIGVDRTLKFYADKL